MKSIPFKVPSGHVVFLYVLLHVSCGRVAHLHCVSVEDFPKCWVWATLKEPVNQPQEQLSHVGLHLQAKWGVEPSDMHGSLLLLFDLDIVISKFVQLS